MTVLVTGAGGLTASRIVHKLVEQGEEVLALDRVSPLSGLEELQQRGKVRVAEADVTDLSAIETAILDNQVSQIIHTAAILPTTSEENPSHGCACTSAGPTTSSTPRAGLASNGWLSELHRRLWRPIGLRGNRSQ